MLDLEKQHLESGGEDLGRLKLSLSSLLLDTFTSCLLSGSLEPEDFLFLRTGCDFVDSGRVSLTGGVVYLGIYRLLKEFDA